MNKYTQVYKSEYQTEFSIFIIFSEINTSETDTGITVALTEAGARARVLSPRRSTSVFGSFYSTVDRSSATKLRGRVCGMV